jgi:hypothetical protein
MSWQKILLRTVALLLIILSIGIVLNLIQGKNWMPSQFQATQAFTFCTLYSLVMLYFSSKSKSK